MTDATWRMPPIPVLLAGVLLIACAEVGGASMVEFKLELTRWARGVMLARPATHGLVGVRDVDEQILDEALVKFDAGLRLFHLHAEGLGTVIIVTAMVAASLVGSAALRRTVVALITAGGALYPLGYLLWSALIPFRGVDGGRAIAKWLVWIPFGSAAIVALWLLTGVLAVRCVRSARAGRVGVAGAALAVAAAFTAPASAHHVGAYVPRDNEVSANFKQIKFSMQAQKFAVALKLYEGGALRRELGKQPGTLPAGLDASIRDALKAGDGRSAETGLMVFFAALVRGLALEADRQLADPRPPPAARVAGGGKILEAIWRYYNLVDFALSERDPRAATAVRLAFEEAEDAAKAAAPAPERMRPPLTTIARVLAGVIEASSPSARRNS